ncbi:cytochrome p450 [Stylonychia lemnae]|uniref:Cytochrome p450 n=1 Tax=Stylonychia lemnae TaxID=5949 RepID=A0A078AUR1_STYLE|nr:cytochrome p450 [Stylonychia lemnae]|eukprot:CDW85751.1 cytochrome p450 [Stylonychia lemnae]
MFYLDISFFLQEMEKAQAIHQHFSTTLRSGILLAFLQIFSCQESQYPELQQKVCFFSVEVQFLDFPKQPEKKIRKCSCGSLSCCQHECATFIDHQALIILKKIIMQQHVQKVVVNVFRLECLIFLSSQIYHIKYESSHSYGVLQQFRLSFAYLLYEKVFKFYYFYWYYKRQGLKSTAFPMPFVGNLFKLKHVFETSDKYSLTPFEEYWKRQFGDDVPPVFSDHRIPEGSVVFSDPNYVNDVFTTKSRYMEKHPKFHRLVWNLFRDSVFFVKSTETWVEKRKHLSTAFYKDKINIMIATAIDVCKHRVDKLRQQVKENGGSLEMSLNLFVQEVIDDVIQACVFGQKSLERKLQYNVYGQEQELSAGTCFRIAFHTFIDRYIKVFRQLTDLFDSIAVDKDEKVIFENGNRLRNYVSQMVIKRREEMNDPNFQSQGDFLTLLCQDPYFDDETIITECTTFLAAANVTNSITVTNAMFYLMRDRHILEKARVKCSTQFKTTREGLKEFTAEQWKAVMNYDGQYPFTEQVILESLRINPPVTFSSPHYFVEDTVINGVKVHKDSQWHIWMSALHHNPKEWREPEKFIPERFDPESEYYLTPAGKKRHPMSFAPFFGGKRICIGKTFAQHILTSILTILINQLDYELADESLYHRKPSNTFLQQEFTYKVRAKELQ